MREVTIRKVLNGFIVQVGCQTLVFDDKAKMLIELSSYIDNPAQMEKLYQMRYGSWGPLEAPGYTEQAQCATSAPTPRYDDSRVNQISGGTRAR
jgi:hypothetical protein